MPDNTREALEAMGHALTARQNLGRLMGITFDDEKGVYVDAADSSSPDGAALGY
jgi:gamma-glutamyltranspeptidase/glutathione hydrolase